MGSKVRALPARVRLSAARALFSAAMLLIGLGADYGAAFGQTPATPATPKPDAQAAPQTGQAPGTTLPSVTVEAPKVKPRPSPSPNAAVNPPPAANAAAAPANTVSTDAITSQGSANVPPLDRTPTVGRTGTPVGEIPGSIQVIPREIVREQGGTSVQDSVRNVSGVNIGGPSTYGFFDRFSIRGLDARIYNDGFSEGDQINGIPHSLNGVSQIEVIKGPGSALLGNGPAGGSINIVHFQPSSTPLYGVSVQVGSYGTLSTNLFAAGPTTVPGLNYRIDALIEHSDGFRDQKSATYELRPSLSWTGDGHIVTVSLDLRHIERTPDPFGILYAPPATAPSRAPLDISTSAKYYSPFVHGNQDLERITVNDAYTVTNYLTVNNRFSYTHRDVDILRNGANGVLTATDPVQFTNRTVRIQGEQHDELNYMFEPVWKFATLGIRHTLVTGAQAEYVEISDHRETSSFLPPITNIFNPTVPETSLAGLTFTPNFRDQLEGTFLGLYAIDQVDVTEKLKLRFTARQDWWERQLTPQIDVPGRFDPGGQLFKAGVTESRIDTPFSWNAGALYKLFPGVSPYVGVSRSYLANFNTEATQNGVAAPESALQYEAGVKFTAFDDRVTLTTAVFKIQRDNVFTLVGDTPFFDNQKTHGFEADLQIKPTPEWKILANFTAQNAVLTFEPQTPTSVGKRPIGIPDYMFNLWTTYDFSIAGFDGFRIGAGLTYNDKSFGDVLNTVYIPASTVFDAALTYKMKDWDLTLGVKNLTDETYYTAALTAGGAPGMPRTFYLKANYRW
jgi:iron complex outermembrane recepter protein